ARAPKRHERDQSNRAAGPRSVDLHPGAPYAVQPTVPRREWLDENGADGVKGSMQEQREPEIATPQEQRGEERTSDRERHQRTERLLGRAAVVVAEADTGHRDGRHDADPRPGHQSPYPEPSPH